jgi:sugar phosphate permease
MRSNNENEEKIKENIKRIYKRLRRSILKKYVIEYFYYSFCKSMFRFSHLGTDQSFDLNHSNLDDSLSK